MSSAPCLACALAAGTAPLPGGTLLRTAHWTVEHCVWGRSGSVRCWSSPCDMSRACMS